MPLLDVFQGLAGFLVRARQQLARLSTIIHGSSPYLLAKDIRVVAVGHALDLLGRCVWLHDEKLPLQLLLELVLVLDLRALVLGHDFNKLLCEGAML